MARGGARALHAVAVAWFAVAPGGCGEGYEVWIEVDEEGFTISAKTAGDECCADWERFDSCGFVDDVTPPCYDCEHCVDAYRVYAGGDEVFRASPSSDFGATVSGDHGQGPEASLDVWIGGCHGALAVTARVPAARQPLESIELVPGGEWGTTEVRWQPSGLAEEVCARVSNWHGETWCCGPDTGQIEVLGIWSLGTGSIRVSVVRLWDAQASASGVRSWERQVSTVVGL